MQVNGASPNRLVIIVTRPRANVLLDGWPVYADLAVSAQESGGAAGRGQPCRVFHRTSQFRAPAIVQIRRDIRLHGPMGRVGSCADNATTTSFCLLRKNVPNRRRWQTRDELRLAIIV